MSQYKKGPYCRYITMQTRHHRKNNGNAIKKENINHSEAGKIKVED